MTEELRMSNYIKQLTFNNRLEILTYVKTIKDGNIKDVNIKDVNIKDGNIKDGNIKDGNIKDKNAMALFLKASTSTHKNYIIRHILSFVPLRAHNIIPFYKCEHFELFKHFKPTHEQKKSKYYHGRYITIEGKFTVHAQENKSMICSRPNWITHIEPATSIEFYTAMGEFGRPNPIFYMIILTTPSGERKNYDLNMESKCPLIIESVY